MGAQKESFPATRRVQKRGTNLHDIQLSVKGAHPRDMKNHERNCSVMKYPHCHMSSHDKVESPGLHLGADQQLICMGLISGTLGGLPQLLQLAPGLERILLCAHLPRTETFLILSYSELILCTYSQTHSEPSNALCLSARVQQPR